METNSLEERHQKQKQPETAAAATMNGPGEGAVSSFPAPPSPALPFQGCPALALPVWI